MARRSSFENLKRFLCMERCITLLPHFVKTCWQQPNPSLRCALHFLQMFAYYNHYMLLCDAQTYTQLYSVHDSSCCPHAGQMLPKLAATQKGRKNPALPPTQPTLYHLGKWGRRLNKIHGYCTCVRASALHIATQLLIHLHETQAHFMPFKAIVFRNYQHGVRANLRGVKRSCMIIQPGKLISSVQEVFLNQILYFSSPNTCHTLYPSPPT